MSAEQKDFLFPLELSLAPRSTSHLDLAHFIQYGERLDNYR